MLDHIVQSRRAIEALRAGVPNRDAVNVLGTAAGEVEERFREQLGAAEDAGTQPLDPAGFLVAGNFGAGKSHLLEYLQHVAREQRFVTSKVVISKETPSTIRRNCTGPRFARPWCPSGAARRSVRSPPSSIGVAPATWISTSGSNSQGVA